MKYLTDITIDNIIFDLESRLARLNYLYLAECHCGIQYARVNKLMNAYKEQLYQLKSA